MKRILFTASQWNNGDEVSLKSILGSAIKKYGIDGITVVVGYTAPHVKIASVAYNMGMKVEAFAPDLAAMPPEYLNITSGVGITSLGEIDYMKHVTKLIDGVVALDDKDPLIFHAANNGKQVWIPNA